MSLPARADEACSAPSFHARKSHALILRRLQSVGQSAAAKAIGVSEPTMSRMKSDGDLDRLCMLLTALGLKVVAADTENADPEYLAHLRYFAARGIAAGPEGDE